MAQTLQEKFIDLINTKNPGLNLTLADVTFGDPAPYTPSTEGDARNTVLTLTAKPESPGFRGSKEYHFTRFNLTHPNGEDAYSWAVTDVHEPWQDDAYALQQFNMNLPNDKPTLDDVTITRWTVPEEPNNLYVKIKLHDTLLKWWGSFVIQVEDVGKQQLMFATGELDGFN
ncbi:hypothetical protein BIZ83_gp114 [Erwinia phage vB_EamM_ChrisDB]|uniref:hypothetical protein n=1 Tax=Erwinia phage vB_EamM_ChrisDB TaxID=1883371 RepID=UPI00081CCA1D|nr:hypothetical protein BIZ83_gp114 [Erwinia phage vB_EamM_ChrisDB]ANZ48739.1 hypothetical protein CHRISDB_177 [Erwinia phage vB_EamM_ChrisDB]